MFSRMHVPRHVTAASVPHTELNILFYTTLCVMVIQGHESGIDEEGDELLQGSRKSAGAPQSYTLTDE